MMSITKIPDFDESQASLTIKTSSKRASGLSIWIRRVVYLLADAATPSDFEDTLAIVPRDLHQINCLVT